MFGIWILAKAPARHLVACPALAADDVLEREKKPALMSITTGLKLRQTEALLDD